MEMKRSLTIIISRMLACMPEVIIFELKMFYNTILCYNFIVVILSVRGLLVRKFMLAAHALGMTKGDWTFLDVEIFQVF